MINGTAARKLAQTASTAGARYVFFFLRKWIRLGTNELLLLQMNWARMRANQRHTVSLITVELDDGMPLQQYFWWNGVDWKRYSRAIWR